ncbi:hypothetical protein HY357_02035, partial [Candidatus Roizmanbacteria bacterium]|nr:hypothetical protein [Candidatus Roizmanbacteria bacterium]
MQFPFFSKQERQSKIFFGLFLKEKEGIGIAIKMVDSRLVLVDEEKFSYSNSWDNLTEDVDELILKLEGRTKVHLDETIFFVYSHFIDEKSKEIKKMYLHTVKNLVKKLELKALGYIECYEAVVNYLEKKEELPLTAVLIELNSADLSVFIYKRGTLAYSKIIAHTDNLIDDLVMCFQEVKGKFLLPSRIILYNSKDLEDEATQIVTHRWSEELFIQLPRVQIVKEHEIIQGLLSVFGEQFSKKKTNVEFEEKKSPQNVLGFVIGEEIGEKTFDSNRAAKPSMQISFSFMRQGLSSFIDKLSLIPRIVSKKLIILLGLAFVVI